MDNTDDCKYLLSLEILERFKDEEAYLTELMSEKYAQLIAAKSEYDILYAKYLELVKAMITNVALSKNDILEREVIAEGQKHVSFLQNNFTTGQTVEYIDPDLLASVRDRLNSAGNFNELSALKEAALEGQSIINSIETCADKIEKNLETLILQDVENLSKRLDAIAVNEKVDHSF